MNEKRTRRGHTLTITVPRWLNWRTVGLSLLISIVILFLALFWAGRNDTTLRDRVYEQIIDLSRLSTVEYKLSTVVQVINPRGVWGNEELVYGVCGHVVAGIDLSRLSKKDIQVDGSHVRITLPPAEIFTVDLLLENDMQEVTEYKLEAEGRTVEMHSECTEAIVWNVPGPLARTSSLVADAQAEALKAFKSTAEDEGIEAEAQKNARDFFDKWFDRLDFETVEIVPSDIKQEEEQ